MNKLSREKRVQVIAALVEGNSIRSTELDNENEHAAVYSAY